MKKVLLLILVAAIIFSVAACGKDSNTTKDDTTSGTTETSTTTETTDTETTEPSSNTGSETGTETTESDETDGDEIDTEDAEEVALGYLTEDDKTTGLTSRRTGSIEFVFTIDGDTYGGTLGLEYPLYDWIVDVTDSDGKTTRINVGYDFDFIADADTGNIKAYFGIETAGFVPNIDDDYTITVYGVDEYGCAYFGTADVTAKLGYNEDSEIVRQPQYLPWRYYAVPYEDEHVALPHEGRVVYVVILDVDDINMFSAANILQFFDVYMFVDGEEYEITEISGWNSGETSVGLRFGVEAAGFKPTTKGQENKIRFEIREKDSDRILFEVEETNVKSNYPFEMTRDPNRAQPDDKQYDQDKITATGPVGFSEEQGIGGAFDGDVLNTKFCTPDITTEPVVITTEDNITLGSISLVTAEDSVRYGGRTPTGFKLEASSDGTTWVTLIDMPTATFSNLDNHKEYNFAIETNKQASYSNYRLTFTGTGTVQFSEIMLFQA